MAGDGMHRHLKICHQHTELWPGQYQNGTLPSFCNLVQLWDDLVVA
jgi:hypothetical protein